MYGVPKFRESFFMKYKKEVLLSVGAFLTIATIVKFVPGQDLQEAMPIEASNNIQAMVAEETRPIVGYKVIINGTEIGLVANEADVDGLVAKAYENLTEDIGYDPEIVAEPAVIPVYEGILTDESSLVEGLTSELKTALGSIKTKAYVMRIGDNFTLALESEEAIKEVLCKAQEKIVDLGEDRALEVDLNANEHNKMVMTPKVLMVNPDEVSMNLTTSGNTDEGGQVTKDQNKVIEDNADVVNEGAAVLNDSVNSDTSSQTSLNDENTENAPEVETGDVKEVEFAEEITIVETYVDPSEIVDVSTATELITKENEKEKKYVVESGDSPWLIANQNDMSLSELYTLNPDLEGKEKSIQVGDEVVVMKPEPELKVETKVEIVYSEAIPRSTVYRDDPDTYVGRSTTIDSGSDGVMEVTAMVTKLNGVETDREIVSKERVKEPTNKIVAKGSKPFPVKGATGNYIFPVSGYVITSPFGWRWGGTSFHHGVDLAVAWGTPIVAADGGTVIYAGWRNTYGYTVEIDHGNGVMTRYGHCSKILVTVGQAVAKGEDIAKVGSTGKSTGPHVHFEIRFNGTAANPLDYLE